jgi:hypothetical protein
MIQKSSLPENLTSVSMVLTPDTADMLWRTLTAFCHFSGKQLAGGEIAA